MTRFLTVLIRRVEQTETQQRPTCPFCKFDLETCGCFDSFGAKLGNTINRMAHGVRQLKATVTTGVSKTVEGLQKTATDPAVQVAAKTIKEVGYHTVWDRLLEDDFMG